MRQYLFGGVAEIPPATALAAEAAQAADTTLVRIKITIEGYDGNDPAVLGTVTVKNLLTDEEWANVTMTGNVIICEAQGGSPGTYACMIDGKIYGYQIGPVTEGSMLSRPYTFYTVHFMNGAEVYDVVCCEL